jgi:hypothetical protein
MATGERQSDNLPDPNLGPLLPGASTISDRESVRYWNTISDIILPWRSREVLCSPTRRWFFNDIAGCICIVFSA